MGAVNDQRREHGLPAIGSKENVALIIRTALDQLMVDAGEAGLTELRRRLDYAFIQAVEDARQ